MFLEIMGWLSILFIILLIYASIWMDLERAERNRHDLETTPS